MTIYENMRRIRTANHMTQRQVAQACGIQPGTYRTYELGRANPKPATVAKIAAALGTTPEILYGIDAKNATGDLAVSILQSMLAESGHPVTDCISEYNCLILSYQKLNQKGREEAVRRIAEMACVPEYLSPGALLETNQQKG